MLVKKFFKTKDEAEITFVYRADGVSEVALAGDFNDWQPQAMKLNKKEQCFKLKLRLPNNQQFGFRYFLDQQQWENDPQADAYRPNGLGSDNSVVSTFQD